jgi:hypothetical protein
LLHVSSRIVRPMLRMPCSTPLGRKREVYRTAAAE